MGHVRTLRAVGAAVALLASWSCGEAGAPDSVYTSIRVEDCSAPPRAVAAEYEARDLGVQQCPAPEGWQLLLVATDENSWVELRGPASWSGERAIVYDAPIGLFPSVDASERVEWRRNARGELTALIFRVTAASRETLTTQESAVYVVRIASARACLLGREASSEQARTLADSDGQC